MSSFLPFVDQPKSDLLQCLARIGPVIVTPESLTAAVLHSGVYVLASQNDSTDQIISWLDNGAEKVVVPLQLLKELPSHINAERLLLLVSHHDVLETSEETRKAVSGFIVRGPAPSTDILDSVLPVFGKKAALYIWTESVNAPTISQILAINAAGASTIIPTSHLTSSSSTLAAINVADAFLAPLTSDRADGLFPTVVTSHTQGGKSLGVVYSSTESVRESIFTGKGVYQSRKHGLWRKGETSGATQQVIRIKLDCDNDALEFAVVQSGAGFCHLDRPSCFGNLTGLAALEMILKSRKESAPLGSYTQRLFNDPDLLRSKIMEEADELCRAQTKEDVAFEAADLIYFALTKCTAAGVSIADIERSLDLKAKKVTRRPGNAKPVAETTSQVPSNMPSAPIRMSTSDLSTITPQQRSQLLRRPVLNSDQMIQKVKPIVDAVRLKGDAALLNFTAKFDKVNLQSVVELPPFAPSSMQLSSEVRAAIDVAYSNVRKFHAAQFEPLPLVVETMPGVVCSRFARPIARVGLYVPGGTAILPSTALMLGIPAQVAGCREIVIATPPRSDGSVSPEVMYVAHLVGATAVVKAGGAQAVAALAYGTETVPKVDKIFGPGNQWVTAAKMLVQNDTDALVAIDMPAGPSEVLVIADQTCNPAFVAADLLSQAEHGIDSQVVLVAIALSPAKLAAIESEVDAQANVLARVDIIRQSVAKSIIIQANTLAEGIAFSNDYAPEHLILHLENAKDNISKIENAGSVFAGPYTPESCGDYASGTNHTLPTNGYARQFSGVNTLSFQKHITSQEITADGLKVLGPVVATLADCEGLQAHANAVRVRLQALK